MHFPFWHQILLLLDWDIHGDYFKLFFLVPPGGGGVTRPLLKCWEQHILRYFLYSVHLFILAKYGLQHRVPFSNWCYFTNILGEYIHRKLVTFFTLVMKTNHDSFMPRDNFVSCIIFNDSVILMTRRGAYSSINYSTMLCRN